MSQTPYSIGGSDARTFKGPRDVSNLPSQTQEKYNAGYAQGRKEQQKP